MINLVFLMAGFRCHSFFKVPVFASQVMRALFRFGTLWNYLCVLHATAPYFDLKVDLLILNSHDPDAVSFSDPEID
jgi:hypothetical protein